MKKLLTLILCWLLAFEAFGATTFKAKTAASVAGGYVTSLNKVDGSFEDGSTQWSASVGTIVPTASTEFQGNYKGVWAGTGTGTLDLQWTATASNTYEASAQVNVGGEDDVYVCAYVGTTETGCKLIPALNKIQKVSVIANSVLSSSFYLRLKHTGSDAFSVEVDDGKIEPWTPQAVNLVQKESVSFKGTGLLSTTGTIKFPTSGFNKQWSNLAVYDQSTGRLTSKVNGAFSGGISLIVNNSANRFYLHKNGSFVGVSNTTPNATDYLATLPFSVDLNAGDYLTVETDGGVNITQSAVNSFNITASAISENVIQTYQPSEFLGEIKLLPTTTAPKGFIPADGKSIGKSSGTYQGDAYYALYALRWAMATTTAGEPYVISSAKGADALSDWNAGKTITIDVRGLFFRAAGGNAGAVGSKQSDAFQGHYHSFKIGSNEYGQLGMRNAPGTVFQLTAGDGGAPFQNMELGSPKADLSGIAPRTATETRPINTSEYAYMRYGNDAPTLYALPTRSEVFSANVSASGTVTNATQNFVTTCTNAAPSVCSLWSNFGVAPICQAHTVDITKRAEVSSSTATTTTVARTDTSTAFNLFCHLK